jgi:hypothetical protein
MADKRSRVMFFNLLDRHLSLALGSELYLRNRYIVTAQS